MFKKKPSDSCTPDEIWPFVGSKQNKVWIWIAVDRDSRRIAGSCAVSRDEDGAAGLWKSIHPASRKRAVFHFWPAYEEAFPRSRHFSVGKESGKTSNVERFTLTLRQRMPRLEIKTLSLSKNMRNPIGAIWNFFFIIMKILLQI